MKNKVYYGEYSLKHWVDLILSQNLVLPDYQRSFAWRESQVKRLIQAFQEDLYVPPVTIASYQLDNGKHVNWVLDGQQRLTSILLAYLGYFPNQLSDWNFTKIQDMGNNKAKILPKLDDNYKNLRIDINDNFLENHYLGFSFLIPQLDNKGNKTLEDKNLVLKTKNERLKKTKQQKEQEQTSLKKDDEKYKNNSRAIENIEKKIEENKEKMEENIKENTKREQNKYYVSIFRAINIEGKSLSNQESREALFYLEPTLKPFFDPDFISNYKLRKQKIDFVRYLSLVSEYIKNGLENTLQVNPQSLNDFENYYVEYICSVVNNEESDLFGNFLNIFPNKEYKNRLQYIESFLKGLYSENHKFNSILEVDIIMFGLVNFILFKNKKLILNIDKLDTFKQSIKLACEQAGKVPYEDRNNIIQIKKRLERSLDIYKEFIDESA